MTEDQMSAQPMTLRELVAAWAVVQRYAVNATEDDAGASEAAAEGTEHGEAVGFLTDAHGRCPRCGDTNSVNGICLTCTDPCAPFSVVHWPGIVAALKAERDGLRRKLDAVRALHRVRVYVGADGVECEGITCIYDDEIWPCPTIQAIESGEA